MPLTIDGCDAAGLCTSGAYTKTIYVDNSHPWVSLASPGEVAETGQDAVRDRDRGRQPIGNR